LGESLDGLGIYVSLLIVIFFSSIDKSHPDSLNNLLCCLAGETLFPICVSDTGMSMMPFVTVRRMAGSGSLKKKSLLHLKLKTMASIFHGTNVLEYPLSKWHSFVDAPTTAAS